MQSIVEMFRIALDNIGRENVKFTTGGMLQRRKSKVPLLDVPKGMPRNLSESQLLQISSKAFSNVAGQFSKLGQSLNPNKTKSNASASSSANNSKRTSPTSVNKTAQINPQVMRQSQTSIEKAVEAMEKPVFTVGRQTKYSSGSDSEENDSSIYEPDIDSDTELAISAITAAEKVNFNNENNFLPSVGIVMGNAQEAAAATQSSSGGGMQQLQDKDNYSKHLEDVSSISISSVANNVTLPTGLLENAPPVRPITPNPQICVQDDGGNFTATNAEDQQQARSVFYL